MAEVPQLLPAGTPAHVPDTKDSDLVPVVVGGCVPLYVWFLHNKGFASLTQAFSFLDEPQPHLSGVCCTTQVNA